MDAPRNGYTPFLRLVRLLLNGKQLAAKKDAYYDERIRLIKQEVP
jgi:hypothetical protein